jgi:hypothetical protein
MKKIISFTLIQVLMQINFAFAQLDKDSVMASELDTSKVVKITLTDNSVLFGQILAESDTLTEFKSSAGLLISIKPNIIKEKEYLKGETIDGKYIRYDPSNSRLFFFPTARTAKAGSGYFSDYELLFPFLSISVTDFIVLSGGMSILPGASEQLIFIAPKVRFFNSENFCASGGLLYINIPEEVDNVALGYGVITIGSQKAGLSLGYGTQISSSSEDDLTGLVIIGGDIQVSNSVKLMSENYIPVGIEDMDIVYSFGVRFFGDNLSVDLGFFGVTAETRGWPFIPWVGFAYNF